MKKIIFYEDLTENWKSGSYESVNFIESLNLVVPKYPPYILMALRVQGVGMELSRPLFCGEMIIKINLV